MLDQDKNALAGVFVYYHHLEVRFRVRVVRRSWVIAF